MTNFTKRQLLTLIFVGIVGFFNSICISLQAPFYPAEAEKKGCTATEYGLVFGVFEFVVFIISPLFGQHLNKIGPKVTFNGGIYVVGICVILFGFLDKIEGRYPFIILSVIVRIIEGMGNAAYWTSSFAIVTREFPDKVATAFAMMEAFSGIGLIVGPTIGGALFQVGGYTLPFAVMGSALFVSAILTSIILPRHQNDINRTIGPSAIKALKIAGVFLATVSVVVTSMSLCLLQATLEPHLRVFHLAPVFLGLMFIINGGVYAVTTPIWGWLCDVLSTPKKVTVVGAILVAAGFCLIGPAPFIPLPTILWVTVTGLILQGLGMSAQLVAAFSDALKTVIIQGFSDGVESYALISGLWVSAFAFGAFIGPSLGGFLYDTIGFRKAIMFVVGINLLVAVATVIFLMMTKPRPSYIEIKEHYQLPNCDTKDNDQLQSHNGNRVDSLPLIESGISEHEQKSMNNPIACNSYKSQAWADEDPIKLPYSLSYGATYSRSGTA